jgi:hypothetical protein
VLAPRNRKHDLKLCERVLPYLPDKLKSEPERVESAVWLCVLHFNPISDFSSTATMTSFVDNSSSRSHDNSRASKSGSNATALEEPSGLRSFLETGREHDEPSGVLPVRFDSTSSQGRVDDKNVNKGDAEDDHGGNYQDPDHPQQRLGRDDDYPTILMANCSHGDDGTGKKQQQKEIKQNDDGTQLGGPSFKDLMRHASMVCSQRYRHNETLELIGARRRRRFQLHLVGLSPYPQLTRIIQTKQD